MIVDKIYIGNIITMEDPQLIADTVAIGNGKIIKVGNEEDILSLGNENTEIIRLGSKTMMPGFIDAHGHFSTQVLISDCIDLQSPPYGKVDSISKIQSIVKSYIDENNIKENEWVIGFGHSEAKLEEGRHPNKFELDEISTTHPIILWDISIHFFAVNSLGLKVLGLNEDIEDPIGGKYRRIGNTRELNGIGEGTTSQFVLPKLPIGSIEDLLGRIKVAERLYNSYGVTTIQDGGARLDEILLLKEAANRGIFETDIVVYPARNYEKALEALEPCNGQYYNHLKLGGIKAFIDGSYYGTVKMRDPYLSPANSNDKNYTGLTYITDEKFEEFIKLGFDKNIQLMVHASGNAAIDMFLDGYEKQVNECKIDVSTRRDIPLHYIFGDEKQSDRVKELNLLPSYFTPRIYFAVDFDIERYNEELISNVSPAYHAVERDMKFTIHMDSPIYPPDMLTAAQAAVTRVTESGKVLSQDLRIEVIDALKALTIHGAYQYGEEDIKGSIAEGKLADFVILDKSPLEVNPHTLRDICVLETIKEGKTLYKDSSVDIY